MILSMEGTDPIVTPDQADEWFAGGLRAAGIAHYGRSQHAYGTAVSGPLSAAGIELLRKFEDLGIILDVTHLCDHSMEQALDLYDGPILASHHNCRALVPGDRQLTDEQITQLISRGAVIGAALDAWMLYPDWIRGRNQVREVVGLTAVADHISTTSANWPATPATPRSAAISTAASAPSKLPVISTPSLTCKTSRPFSSRAATAIPISTGSSTETGSAFSPRRFRPRANGLASS